MNIHTKFYSSAAAVLVTAAASILSAMAGIEDETEKPPGPISGDNPNIGIKYDKSQGLYVTPFSAKFLGLKMADVEEKEISYDLTLHVQIFDVSPEEKALGSAWLPQEDAEKLAAGNPVELEHGYRGKIVSIAGKLNQLTEAILEIEDKEATLKSGKFLTGTVEIKSDGEVVVVPKEAVVKSAEGTFAYVDNAGWTIRTEVEIGAEQNEFVEIVDGLYTGDVVVTAPVMTLWMTELQLLKSGKA
jgi:hypothetical protein